MSHEKLSLFGLNKDRTERAGLYSLGRFNWGFVGS